MTPISSKLSPSTVLPLLLLLLLLSTCNIQPIAVHARVAPLTALIHTTDSNHNVRQLALPQQQQHRHLLSAPDDATASAKEEKSVSCTRNSACVACTTTEADGSSVFYCSRQNWYKQELKCVETIVNAETQETQTREYSEWAACESPPTSSSAATRSDSSSGDSSSADIITDEMERSEWGYWIWNLCIAVIFICSYAAMLRRKSILNTIQNRRLDRLVNS